MPGEVGTPGLEAVSERSSTEIPGLREVLTIIEECPAAPRGGTGRLRRRVAVAAVVGNPLAGQAGDDLSALVALGRGLGEALVARATRALAGASVAAAGKAAMVGQDGELEHAAALIGPGFSAAVRRSLGGLRAGSASVRRLDNPGAVVEVRLNAAEGASDGEPRPFEVRVPGHPLEDEAVVVLVVAEFAA